MKNWKLILLVAGILLIVAGIAVYAARITSCYPPESIWTQFSPDHLKELRQTCHFDSPVLKQFSGFLILFVPGKILFSLFWLLNRPGGKNRRGGDLLNFFLLFLLLDSLIVIIYGLLGYPAPGAAHSSSAWAMETIAVFGFLCFLAILAIWHWKRWGMMLFQGAGIALAVFILMGGGSLILAAVIVAGVIGLSFLLRPIRNYLG